MATVLQNFWVDANTNINMRDSDGKTALMYAVSGKNSQLIKPHMLLARNANADATDDTGKTALMYAAEGGDIGKVRLLLAAGANASVQTQDGKTAADFAKGNGKCFADAVRKLLK